MVSAYLAVCFFGGKSLTFLALCSAGSKALLVIMGFAGKRLELALETFHFGIRRKVNLVRKAGLSNFPRNIQVYGMAG